MKFNEKSVNCGKAEMLQMEVTQSGRILVTKDKTKGNEVPIDATSPKWLKLSTLTCSLYIEMSSKDFALLTANTSKKPSPVLMY